MTAPDLGRLDREWWPEHREWLRSRLQALDMIFRPSIESMVFGG